MKELITIPVNIYVNRIDIEKLLKEEDLKNITNFNIQKAVEDNLINTDYYLEEIISNLEEDKSNLISIDDLNINDLIQVLTIDKDSLKFDSYETNELNNAFAYSVDCTFDMEKYKELFEKEELEI